MDRSSTFFAVFNPLKNPGCYKFAPISYKVCLPGMRAICPMAALARTKSSLMILGARKLLDLAF
jgi:hypothetical protein